MAKRKSLSDVEFVKAWTKAESLDEAVAAIGLSRVGAQARASRLRKAGVRLRRFRRRKTVDVKGLNALLKKLAGRGKRSRRGRRTRRARKAR